ncbi:armadillo-type protein [Aspergillus cavernicola]|uniref:Armadillo-type protein n=1 Tax=Aspergillus cavernicola TaxID=176166 RepID=A0ABR4HEM0_9EURO
MNIRRFPHVIVISDEPLSTPHQVSTSEEIKKMPKLNTQHQAGKVDVAKWLDSIETSPYNPGNEVNAKPTLSEQTPENLRHLLPKLREIVSPSTTEGSGAHSLQSLVLITLHDAIQQPHQARQYAVFCKYILDNISPDIKDENLRDRNGNPFSGASLFRKYLLNPCQEEFSQIWDPEIRVSPDVPDELSAKLGLGVLAFLGELYMVDMLTDRIIHECIKSMLANRNMPVEARVEALTTFLRIVGAKMDTKIGAVLMMDVYFSKIGAMTKDPTLPSRLKTMLQDIIGLRQASWPPVL